MTGYDYNKDEILKNMIGKTQDKQLKVRKFSFVYNSMPAV